MDTGEISVGSERRDWSELDLFPDLNQVEIEALRRALEPVKFKSGSAIMREDETGNGMFLLDRGSVKVEAHGSDATSRFSTILHAPTAFGEMALITDAPRSASVQATTETCTVVITSDLVEQGFEKLPGWMNDVVQAICERFEGQINAGSVRPRSPPA